MFEPHWQAVGSAGSASRTGTTHDVIGWMCVRACGASSGLARPQHLPADSGTSTPLPSTDRRALAAAAAADTAAASAFRI